MKSCAELCVYMNGKWSLIRTLPKEPLIRAVFFILIVVFRSIRFGAISSVPTEATEMFHILKNAENPHFYGFRLHTFRTTDKVVRYGINNQFDFAEHPAVIQHGEKRTINICVAVPDVA